MRRRRCNSRALLKIALDQDLELAYRRAVVVIDGAEADEGEGFDGAGPTVDYVMARSMSRYGGVSCLRNVMLNSFLEASR